MVLSDVIHVLLKSLNVRTQVVGLDCSNVCFKNKRFRLLGRDDCLWNEKTEVAHLTQGCTEVWWFPGQLLHCVPPFQLLVGYWGKWEI